MIIRNIAILAHVDHGKTTLVDAMLKQSSVFRNNQKEMKESLLLDSGDLEREKGITILAKNTAIMYGGQKINIIDTPGHADFGSEVERVLNMASGALLLVDSAEGPLPQTRYVLKKAFEVGLKIIVCINKIDRKDARSLEVLREIESLFLENAKNEDVLNFTTLFTIGRKGIAKTSMPTNQEMLGGDLKPLFEAIINEIPNSAIGKEEPFQMLVSTLDYDDYVGRLCIGKVSRGVLKKGDKVTLMSKDKDKGFFTVTKLYTSLGLSRKEVDEVEAGDIIAIAGIPEMDIGDTVVSPQKKEWLEPIVIEKPTLKITIGPNTSPFAGREGKFITSRQIKNRLDKEIKTNIGYTLERGNKGTVYTICGRGELHLSILIETMRREGFEMEVTKPQVIYKEKAGLIYEPYEELTIDVNKDYMGLITEELGKRKGDMIDMYPLQNSFMRLIYRISSRNLIGIRNLLITATKGTVLLHRYYIGYGLLGPNKESTRNGVLIATQSGISLTYGLVNAQYRGDLFIGPGIDVYEGMVIGLSSGERDIEVNVCKGKKLTNNRSVGEGVKTILEPYKLLSLEQYLDLIGDDEILEITPKNIRLRKKYLTIIQRRVVNREQNK